MSKIVIDARELRTSSGRYVERLLHYLQIIDTTNHYNVLLKPTDMLNWVPTNTHFEKVVCPIKEFSLAEQLAMRRQIRRLKPDLVHFPFPQQPVLYHGRVVTTIHDLTTLRFNNPDKNLVVFKLKQLIYKQVMKRVARKSVRVLTGSAFVKEDIVSFAHINPDKITVTREAAEPITEAAKPIPGLLNKPFIMYVGRPTPHKNLERLVEAFILLKAQHKDLVLVLAGKKDTNYLRLERRVHEKDIDNVLFTDFVSEGQLRWLYENCAAYIFPSLSEGFGLPGLEAMVHGAPLVSSNATCLPEIYGDAAQYFDPLHVQAMADAINSVLINDGLRADLIKKGKLQAAKYSWKRMAEQTLEVYAAVLGT